jgi:hypothetical protein
MASGVLRALHERFREANDGIREVARRHGVVQCVPFLCECAEVECARVACLPVGVYDRVRRDPARFLVFPGHERAEVDAVVEHLDGWLVVQSA